MLFTSYTTLYSDKAYYIINTWFIFTESTVGTEEWGEERKTTAGTEAGMMSWDCFKTHHRADSWLCLMSLFPSKFDCQIFTEMFLFNAFHAWHLDSLSALLNATYTSTCFSLFFSKDVPPFIASPFSSGSSVFWLHQALAKSVNELRASLLLEDSSFLSLYSVLHAGIACALSTCYFSFQVSWARD